MKKKKKELMDFEVDQEKVFWDHHHFVDLITCTAYKNCYLPLFSEQKLDNKNMTNKNFIKNIDTH